MISPKMKRFIEETGRAMVASADQFGHPHLAVGEGLTVRGRQELIFEAWFCRETLTNIQQNPYIAVAVIDAGSGRGYQLTGRVVRTTDVALHDGLPPRAEEPGLPQVQWRVVIRVEQILEFAQGVHSDQPLTPEA